jgi:penicillin-binding protein-related factor A (putative recombinase)
VVVAKEIWIPIKDYEGFYEVSNLGRVRSLDRIVNGRDGLLAHLKGRMVTIGKESQGYCRVSLSKDGNRKMAKLHRLIAQAFLPNPCGKPHINHKNGIKNDNRIENLEWVTPLENAKHAVRTGLYKAPPPKYGKDHVKSRCIVATDKNGNEREFEGIRDAERETGISASNICSNLQGKTKTAGKLMWRYVNEEKEVRRKLKRSRLEIRLQTEMLHSVPSTCHYVKIPDMPKTLGSKFLVKKPYDCFILYKGNVYCVETKMHKSACAWPYKKITSHQINSLKKAYNNRALSYVFLNVRYGRGKQRVCKLFAIHIVPFTKLYNKYVNSDRQSIPLHEFDKLEIRRFDGCCLSSLIVLHFTGRL